MNSIFSEGNKNKGKEISHDVVGAKQSGEAYMRRYVLSLFSYGHCQFISFISRMYQYEYKIWRKCFCLKEL